MRSTKGAPLLEYSRGAPTPWDPVTRRLVVGTLSLIFSIAAIALLVLGAALRHTGGNTDRAVGGMAIYTSVAPGLLGLGAGALARWRARDGRGLAILAVLLNVAYWAGVIWAIWR
jgi:hypothetical protein